MKHRKKQKKRKKVVWKKRMKKKPAKQPSGPTLGKMIEVITGKEFICSTCGYEATKLARLSHCPLCLLCKGCGKKVRDCCCLEGE